MQTYVTLWILLITKMNRMAFSQYVKAMQNFRGDSKIMTVVQDMSSENL